MTLRRRLGSKLFSIQTSPLGSGSLEFPLSACSPERCVADRDLNAQTDHRHGPGIWVNIVELTVHVFTRFVVQSATVIKQSCPSLRASRNVTALKTSASSFNPTALNVSASFCRLTSWKVSATDAILPEASSRLRLSSARYRRSF